MSTVPSSSNSTNESEVLCCRITAVSLNSTKNVLSPDTNNYNEIIIVLTHNIDSPLTHYTLYSVTTHTLHTILSHNTHHSHL